MSPVRSSNGRFSYRLALIDGGTYRRLGGVHEISGLSAAGTVVTLRRATVNQADLYAWLGRGDTTAQARTIRIDLMSEDGRSALKSWQVVDARPVKYTGPALDAAGSEVAIEELVLSAERIETA